jgi:predicted RNase H-like HicB family nuclease
MTLHVWQDEERYVGQLLQIPSVMSQARTLFELEANIREAYELLTGEPADTLGCHWSR